MSRRHRTGTVRARDAEGRPVEPVDPSTVGVNYRCRRNHLDGEREAVWKVRRDESGDQAGILWFKGGGLSPEHVDYDRHGGLFFLCPVCGLETWLKDATVHGHLDEVAASGRRVASRLL